MSEPQPIVIRKVKKHVHGHHGGAWKVALADFTTAMMAFFLLLWLLAVSSTDQKAAISEYFRNPSAYVGADPNAPPQPMRDKLTMPIPLADQGGNQDSTESSEGEETEPEIEFLEELKNDLIDAIEAAPELSENKDQMLLDIMPEGLRIQIVDQEQRPMFDLADASLKSHTRALLLKLAPLLEGTDRGLSITGHTDARKLFVSGKTNWELSTERANAARRALVEGGISDDKVARIVGLAATVPLDKQDPLAALNRRVSIIVLKKPRAQASQDEAKERENALKVDQDTTTLPNRAGVN